MKQTLGLAIFQPTVDQARLDNVRHDQGTDHVLVYFLVQCTVICLYHFYIGRHVCYINSYVNKTENSVLYPRYPRLLTQT
jgi:hypothetical protein